MTQDEIIEIARQAGLVSFSKAWGCFWVEGLAAKNGQLEAFAKLVDAKATAKEREACAKICEEVRDFTAANEIRARGEA